MLRYPLTLVFVAVATAIAQVPRPATENLPVQQQPEAYSLFGRPLYRPELPKQTKAQLDSNYAIALANYHRDPHNAENIIWLGRRAAYLWRYREAIEIFSEGIQKFPDDPRLYRHRGHRYITVREFDKAIADLEKAASLIANRPDEIEPDGQPNRYNIPTSTLHSNIWYHLGLAYYLKGDFPNALRCYQECLKVSTNPDMLCATSDWLYMTLRRLGKTEEAAKILLPISNDMNILENHAYHRRLLMYKGELPLDALLNTANASELDIATQGYGVGNWYLYNGHPQKAQEMFEKVLAGNYWAAFGYIAAEADLKRMRNSKD
jgi:tetratricopeptide (TPR) repeat protein